MAVNYDAAVVGLGAAGSAALSFLGRAGVSAVGIDRFTPPHAEGSSHGETRLLRVAYAEGELYAPMARRAVELWRKLEERSGQELFRQSGVLYAGPRSSPFLNASLSSARAHDVRVDTLTRAERGALSPALDVPSDWLCCAEREGGYLFPERAIDAFLQDAQAHGAEVRGDDACVDIACDSTGVIITTGYDRVRTSACIVAVGAWTASLLPALAPHLTIERKTLHWFGDPDGVYAPSRFMPFLIDNDSGLQVYGFPDCGSGVKVAEHSAPSAAYRKPDDIDRTISPADIARVEDLARPACPALGPLQRSTTCLYPMSADGHFIIDAVPGMDRVFVAAGLSGHGFKFAPVIGEAVANLALGRPQSIDLEPFSLSRFQ